MNSEKDAVLRAQAGDSAAFRVVVESHGPTLFRAAVMMTRDPGTAEDAVQETFIKAWNGIASFKAGTQLKAWLVRILINHLNGVKRRKSLNPVRLLPGLFERAAPDTPESLFLFTESSREIFALLDLLRRDEKTVIILHYYMEMSLAEVSESTGWAAGTVRSRLSRALAKLRKHLTAGTDTMNDTARRTSHDEA